LTACSLKHLALAEMAHIGTWIFISSMVMFGSSCCHAYPEALGNLSNRGMSPTTTTTAAKTLKLLVMGGEDQYWMERGFLRSVEKIDPMKEVSSCLPVPRYPLKYGSTAQNFGDNFIVSCGSYDGVSPGNICFSYTRAQGWREYVEFDEDMDFYFVESVLINDFEMWIFGGQRNEVGSWIINTKNRSEKGGIARRGPDLPGPGDERWVDHCVVKINQTHVFISNGFDTMYMVNVSEEPFEFTRLSEAQYPRTTHYRIHGGGGCGFVRMKNEKRFGYDGAPAIIMAGGSPFERDIDYIHRNSTIFLIERNQWVDGPKLPHKFYIGKSVNPDDQTFILAGGYDGSEYLSDIIQLDLDAMEFVTLPGKFKEPRAYFAMTWMMDEDECRS